MIIDNILVIFGIFIFAYIMIKARKTIEEIEKSKKRINEMFKECSE